MVDISVLIVNYNGAAFVSKCIESLLIQQQVNFEIIVVDNQSQDASVSILRQFEPRITLIANQDNKGFGRANNQAFKVSQGRYIFMLNPDAICLSPLDLSHAVQFMEAHSEFGLVGTRIVNVKNHLEHTVFHRYPHQRETSADFSTLPGKIATVLGASMVARREVLEKVSGFDEDFFLYGEETDLCLRIRKQGHAIGACETVTVQHIGGASEKGNPRAEILRKKKAGKLLFYTKHYPHQDVVKLMKHDLRRAKLHLLRLSVMKLFGVLSKKNQAKYQQYQVVAEVARGFIKESVTKK